MLVLQLHFKLLTSVGDDSSLTWMYRRCLHSEYSVFASSGNGTLSCVTCPKGANCQPVSGTQSYLL
jgi:hypothetical protein